MHLGVCVCVCVSLPHSLSIPFECRSCVSMATLTPRSQCYFFHTSSLFRIPPSSLCLIHPSLPLCLPLSTSSSPVLSPPLFLLTLLFTEAIKNTLYSLSALLQPALFSPYYISFSLRMPSRFSNMCAHMVHLKSLSCSHFSDMAEFISESLLWFFLSLLLLKDASKDSSSLA